MNHCPIERQTLSGRGWAVEGHLADVVIVHQAPDLGRDLVLLVVVPFLVPSSFPIVSPFSTPSPLSTYLALATLRLELEAQRDGARPRAVGSAGCCTGHAGERLSHLLQVRVAGHRHLVA